MTRISSVRGELDPWSAIASVVRGLLVAASIAVLAIAMLRAEPSVRVVPAPSSSPAVLEGVQIAAVGDIACDPADPQFVAGVGAGATCRQQATSELVVGRGYDAVLVLGDIQYEDGALSAYRRSYEPSWGRVKDITRPVPGNHEYDAAGADEYFEYFAAAAGDPAKGYYSFDLGDWHLVALNSNCTDVGGCEPGSLQERWLRADLAANPARCTLAYWHHPRYSSGEHGSDRTVRGLWQALYDAGADLVLVGHDHDYERFAPQDANGAHDPEQGMRQFVVGTGGHSLRGFPRIEPNSEVRDSSSFGVLELTLGEGAYAWRFRPAVGSFTDSGSASCH